MQCIIIFTAVVSGCIAGLITILFLARILGTNPQPAHSQAQMTQRTHAKRRVNGSDSPLYLLAELANVVVPAPQALMTRTSARLAQAGLNIAPGLWHGASVLYYASVALVATLVITNFSTDAKMRLLFGICLATLVLSSSRLLLVVLTRRRAAKIRAALPLALDLLAVSVEGGLTMSRAITLVCEKSTGPLAEEFKMVMRDIRYLGFTLPQALNTMAERCQIEELTLFVAAISASVAAGAPVATTLKVQSEVMFARHCQELEERVNKMPAQMVIPIGLFMLAAVIIAAVAPIAINILASLQMTGV